MNRGPAGLPQNVPLQDLLKAEIFRPQHLAEEDPLPARCPAGLLRQGCRKIERCRLGSRDGRCRKDRPQCARLRSGERFAPEKGLRKSDFPCFTANPAR